MANREFESLRTNISQPQADTSADQMLNAVGDIGQKIIAADQQAKINDATSRAQLDITQLNQQFRQDNIDDPMNKEKLASLGEARQAIFDTYGEGISPFFKKSWQDTSRELSTKQDVSNELWGYTQTKANTVKTVNNSMQTSFQQANIDGQSYANGSGSLLDALGNFGPSKSNLVDFGDKHIGTEQTTDILKNYDKDYMKSFVAGVAETNPKKATEMLDDPMFKDKFTTEERGDLVDVINKTTKQQELMTSLKTTENTQAVTDLVNDPNQSYFNKRLQIDKLEMSGSIKDKTAANARRVLSSQKDIDAITSSDEMGGVVQMIYDLNANQSLDNSSYLQGTQNIHNLILEKQADGKINDLDVQKLNNEMKTLTSKRVADATKFVGASDLADATEKFQSLPPEYRGEATRQLFYATAGKSENMTDDQFKTLTTNSANKIVDDINRNRRANTVKAVNSINTINEDDTNFLKTKGYTPDDVNETAKIHGITPTEVIKRLRGAPGKRSDAGPDAQDPEAVPMKVGTLEPGDQTITSDESDNIIESSAIDADATASPKVVTQLSPVITKLVKSGVDKSQIKQAISDYYSQFNIQGEAAADGHGPVIHKRDDMADPDELRQILEALQPARA